ncbi:MAG: hypothetical protein U5R31_01880 [Acidimicrobiia bacterium]|nr:hypothetical protein [Acidimicrobiia bacterium]
MRCPDGTAPRHTAHRRSWPTVALALAVLSLLPATGCGWFGGDDDTTDVLLIGDSIMAQSGEFVDEELEEHEGLGGVSVRNEGVNGSGLLTPDLFDWHEQAELLVGWLEPEIVVILFVGNYSLEDPYVTDDGEPIEGYTELFFETWGEEARRLTDIARAGGAEVFWVQPPPMAGGTGGHRAEELRDVYEEVVEAENTGLVDGGTALGDPGRQFTWELPGEGGEPQTVRTPDGVHLHRARCPHPRRRDRRGHRPDAPQPARRDHMTADRPGLAVFAVEPASVQLTWVRVGGGRLRVTGPGVDVDAEVEPGPGALTVGGSRRPRRRAHGLGRRTVGAGVAVDAHAGTTTWRGAVPHRHALRPPHRQGLVRLLRPHPGATDPRRAPPRPAAAAARRWPR